MSFTGNLTVLYEYYLSEVMTLSTASEEHPEHHEESPPFLLSSSSLFSVSGFADPGCI